MSERESSLERPSVDISMHSSNEDRVCAGRKVCAQGETNVVRGSTLWAARQTFTEGYPTRVARTC